MADGFPSFLPKQVEEIKDPVARNLAMRIQRLPVPVSLHFSLQVHCFGGVLWGFVFEFLVTTLRVLLLVCCIWCLC